MRIRTAVRRVCRFCYIVRKKKRTYVYCTANVRVSGAGAIGPENSVALARAFHRVPCPLPHSQHKQRTPFTTVASECGHCGGQSWIPPPTESGLDAAAATWEVARGRFGGVAGELCGIR